MLIRMREKHLLSLAEDKRKQIPLPPRRSKLWNAVRMWDRDDIVGGSFVSLLN